MSEEKQEVQHLTVPRHIIELHWQLTHTREWPISMMHDLAVIKDAYHKAIEAAEGVSNEKVSDNSADAS